MHYLNYFLTFLRSRSLSEFTGYNKDSQNILSVYPTQQEKERRLLVQQPKQCIPPAHRHMRSRDLVSTDKLPKQSMDTKHKDENSDDSGLWFSSRRDAASASWRCSVLRQSLPATVGTDRSHLTVAKGNTLYKELSGGE